MTEKALEKILQEGRERGLYENAFLQVFGAEEVVYAGRAGRATAASLFDVASITKVFTALLVGALVLERRLDDQFRVGDFFPGRVSGPLSLVTVEELLSHTSGLPSWVPLYEEVMNGEGRFTVSPAEKRRETILERLLTLSLESPPGEEIRYSDAGYILLGFLLERGTGKSLKELLRKKITEPLRLMDTGFTPLDEVPHCDSARIVGTGFCHVRRREKVGEPDDLNCYALGGVAGHAGIFSTASDLTALGTYLLRKWREEVEENREGLVTYLLQEVKDRRGRKRFLGFDRPEGENSLAGRGCSPLTAGHLGWTGTSIWIDFGRGRGVVFLTDHVACGGDREEFNQVRRRVHTAAWEVAGG